MLHVLVGATGNNHCLFCMEADRSGRAVHIGARSKADVRRLIASRGSLKTARTT